MACYRVSSDGMLKNISRIRKESKHHRHQRHGESVWRKRRWHVAATCKGEALIGIMAKAARYTTAA